MIYIITAMPMGRTIYVLRGTRTKDGLAFWTNDKTKARKFTNIETAAAFRDLVTASGSVMAQSINIEPLAA
jgi:uncharacterized protein YqjF (DUF2071 family)